MSTEDVAPEDNPTGSDSRSQRERLKQAIAVQESLRGSIDDSVIDASIAALQRQLEELEEVVPADQRRKQVTVLFMDVVGSTDIVRDLDPEDHLAIMEAALKPTSASIEEYGGYVTRFMGDGFMAAFGHKIARENEPEMAVRAGLKILEVAREYARTVESQWGISNFAVRVGVNTGLAVVGGYVEGEETITGSAVHLAARLESTAEPGTLLISHSTYQHVREAFDLLPRKPIEVKGFTDPVRVYRVIKAKPRQSRFASHGVEGIQTRTVGRKREMERLQDTLQEARRDGQRKMITLTGEAGIGKSRILYEFVKWITAQGDQVQLYEGRANRLAQNRPNALVRDLFTAQFQIQENEPPGEARKKIEAGFTDLLGTEERGLVRSQSIGQFLGFDFSDSPGVADLLGNPRKLRQEAEAGMVEFFEASAGLKPVVLILENVHWADDSSLDLIQHLAANIVDRSLFIVCTARPELFRRRSDWLDGREFHSHLELNSLSDQDTRELLLEILQKASEVPTSLIDLVVRRGAGNPFYVEELVKMLVEDEAITTSETRWEINVQRLTELQVPPTLTGVLQARLDRLTPMERKVLQRASVVGRTFWDQALLRSGIDDEATLGTQEVDEILTSLADRELIFPSDQPAFADTSEYSFKHALLRDVTYASILKKQRQTYHALIANWFVEQSGERADEYAGLIGEHFKQTEKPERAIPYLQKAGEQAIKLSANQQAVEHLSDAIELTGSLPDSLDIELKLQFTLGAALMAAKGPGSAEVVAAYGRARAICAQIGETPELVPTLFGLWRYYNLRSMLDKAYEVAEQLYQIAEHYHGTDSPFLLEANLALGATSFWLGRLEDARDRFEHVITRYDPDRHPSHVYLHGQDPMMVLLPYLAFALWHLGFPDQAQQRAQQAIELAEELGHPFSQAYALFGASMVYQFCGDTENVSRFSAATLAISADREFPYFLAIGSILQGWAMARIGHPEEAIGNLVGGLDSLRSTGAEAARTYYLALLAECYEASAEVEEGLEVVREALEIVAAGGESLYEAELLRLQGELLLALGEAGGELPQWIQRSPEEYFRNAIEVARKNGSRSLELRAVLSLCRLLKQAGKAEEARPMLNAAFDSFSEGFQTADLLAASALLESLSLPAA